MNLITNKSLEKYIAECMSQFDYSDFSPPISDHKLASKFAEILFKENAYWEECKPEDEWTRFARLIFLHIMILLQQWNYQIPLPQKCLMNF